MCSIRAEISTHKHLGKCIYLLFIWLAVIGFRQNNFYMLPNFGDFGAKMSFLHYTINEKRNTFIKHCPPPPPCTEKPLISEMCICIKSYQCRRGLGTRGERCSIDKTSKGCRLTTHKIHYIFSDTLNWSDITQICETITELNLITDFDLITKFREVFIEHCNGCD